MNRAEIIEGLKDIYDILYENLYFRKALDLTIIEACLELLESENALIDRVLEIIDRRIVIQEMKHTEANDILHETIAEIRATEVKEIRNEILTLKGSEQE